ncbi:glycoside hydrolase family 16 protein [Pedobacter xixiisoli]|uniref:Glycosyl hydrolases family 16 n=1 Tax=Pedobacter xixiisoli TaxID=1476464 RepID=A0A286ACV1_9SPHI|nr:glycoside hydrolase family 16 protein [Pedobacter xixiisoli]SOD19718.1 Glycosyl hydrolases family 16 [Pedobacter xixiisoli]
MKTHKFFKNWLLILPLLMLNISCKKEASAAAPTSLELVANISDDGSGRVDFVAKANNAERYLFSFGQGTNESIRSNDGKAYTIYAESGTYTVKVIAYAGDKSTEITKQITVDKNEVIDNAGYISPESYPGMTLVWRDEFNGSALDTQFWNFEEGNGTEGWGNWELQYYRKENTKVHNGYLTITAKKESFGGKEYTSSRLTTEAKKDFLYGRIEMRAKLPKGQGIWPAFWALGANIRTTPWPFSGEIDIMEMVGGGPGKDNTLHGTVHYEDGGHKYVGGSTTLPSGDFYDKFHVFSIVWTASSIKWYLDNIEFYTFDTTGANKDEFRRPYFLLLNLAVGGNWPGSPNASTVFPQKYIVDYVRVFQ